jgi:hypothetical protein
MQGLHTSNLHTLQPTSVSSDREMMTTYLRCHRQLGMNRPHALCVDRTSGRMAAAHLDGLGTLQHSMACVSAFSLVWGDMSQTRFAIVCTRVQP